MKIVRRIARDGLATLGLATTFVLAIPVGLSIHSDLPAVRRLGARIANDALSGLFEGTIVMGGVDALSIGPRSRVKAAHVSIRDPEGRLVILASSVEADVRLDVLLTSLLSGGPPKILIGEARIDAAEVALDLDPDGDLGLVKAFRPTPNEAGAATASSAPGEEDVVLRIDRALIDHAWVHGNVTPPALDGDADEVRARLAIEHDTFTLAVDGANTTLRGPRAPGQNGVVRGVTTGAMSVPLATGDLSGHVDLRGDAAGVPVILHAGIANEAVDASFVVARAEPAAVSALFPAIHPEAPLELSATAKGKLPAIQLTADARTGTNRVTASGEIDLREGNAFSLEVDAAHVDAAIAGGPPSDLSAHASAHGNLGSPESAVFHVTTTAGSTFAGQPLPATVAEGTLEDGKVTSTFRASEPGAEASGRVVFVPKSHDLAFDLQARSSDLASLARAPRVVSGAASMRATGHVDVATGTVIGRVTANGESLAHGPIAARRARAEAALHGPVSSPVIDVAATGEGVTLTASGKEPLTYPKAAAHARIFLTPHPHLSQAGFDIGEPDAPETVSAEAATVDLGPSGIVVRRARVTGLGPPIETDIDVGKGSFSIRAKADDIDVRRAGALTGIEELKRLPRGTRADVDVDVTSSIRGAQGHADVAVTAPRGDSAEVHLTLSDRHVSGTARATLAEIAAVEVPTVELDLDGPPNRIDALSRATGVVEANGVVDLSKVEVFALSKGLAELKGKAAFEARLERGDAEGLPSIRGTVRTQGLEIGFAPDAGFPPVRDVDVEVHAEYDGLTDDAELALIAEDRHGAVATADLKVRAPLTKLTRANDADRMQMLSHLPLSAVVDVPQRALRKLPELLMPPDLDGKVALRGEIEGSLASPHVHVLAQAMRLRQSAADEPRRRYKPVDGSLELEWDGDRFVFVLAGDERDVKSKKPRRVRASGRVRGMVLGRIKAGDLLASTPDKPLPWSASGTVAVDDLELAPLPLPSRLQGSLTGRATLREAGGTSPSLDGSFRADRFAFSGARMDAVDVTISARDGAIEATARALDAGRQTLRLVLGSKALVWRGAAIDWDPSKRTHVEYEAAGLRLALVRPFARDVIADVDGRLDGHGSADFDSSSQSFQGALALSDGRLYLRPIGEDITDVNAILRFEKSGAFRVDDVGGRVGEGEFRGSAAGKLKGLSFESASASIVIPSKNGIPLSSESVTYADATGTVRLDAAMSDDRKTLLIDVDVPQAKLDLPRSEAPKIMTLAPDPAIEMGIRGPRGKFTPVVLGRHGETEEEEEDQLSTRFTITLGKDVRLEGKGLSVLLRGKAVVDVGDEVDVTGRIDLAGGSIEAHGRRFTIDHGAVTFAEGDDPTNPTIVAAAYWDAPDRTRIWVEFAGPLKTGELTLRSEPSYSKNEILSILLFGRPDPNMATAGQRPSDASRGVAIGTGFLATDINQGLAELDENLQVETDTLSGNRTRAKVGYRVGRALRVQLGYAPGRTYREPDTTFLFLDWQFLPKLSLVATEGNRGTSILDVIFQHRY